MATLITGLGYIGSALALRLIEQGEHVVGIENFFSTPRAALSPLLETGALSLIDGSIADEPVLKEAFTRDRIESVFHLAAQASARPDAASLAYTQETNFTGPRLLLDASLGYGVKRVVLASSMRLYRTPLPETVTEDAPIAPTDLVHLSQLYGEVLLDEHRRRAEVERGSGRAFASAAARLGIVHGVGPVMKTDPRFLAAPQLFCLQAATGQPLNVAGDVSLAFVHLEDTVTALLACREHAEARRVVNVGCEVRSVASVAAAVRDAGAKRGLSVDVRLPESSPPLPNPPPPRGREQRHRLPPGAGENGRAASRIESALAAYGFAPRLCIEESIGAVLDYYLSLRGAACASS